MGELCSQVYICRDYNCTISCPFLPEWGIGTIQYYTKWMLGTNTPRFTPVKPSVSSNNTQTYYDLIIAKILGHLWFTFIT